MTGVDTLSDFLKGHTRGDLVAWEIQMEAAARFNITVRQVESAILSLNLLPARYARNRTTIGNTQQKALFGSTVAVVGCGGLGGYVIEELARLGVGTLRVIDPDVFEEHNLNRQVLCTLTSLGKAKVNAARDRVAEINPVCEVIPIQERLSTGNALSLLGNAAVAVDGLDNVPSRLDLADACAGLRIPLVHGAIGGWYGMVLTQGPAQNTIRKLYGEVKNARGIEESLGNLAFTPALVASLEAAEACKLLTGEGSTLEDRMLFINLLDMSIAAFQL